MRLRDLFVCSFVAVAPFVANFDAQAGDELNSENGRWAYRTQLVLDGRSDKLNRMRLRVWDPHPDLDLEFYWEPTKGASLPADGTVNGWGTLTWRSRGAPRYGTDGIYSSYRGQVADGRAHGVGRLTRSDGLVYEGDWVRGLFDGRGSATFANGDQYDGDFAQGTPHGEGRYVRSDGEMFVGGFHKGKRHGKGKLSLPDGTSVVASWSHGIRGDARSAQWKPFGDGDEKVNLRRIRVGVMPAPNQGLTYDVSTNGIRIGPGKTAVRLLAQKGPIAAYYDTPEGRSLIKLNVRVENRNPAPAFVSNIYLDVAESVADNRPVLIIGGPNECDGAQTDGIIQVRNIGASVLTNVRFSLAFADPKGQRVGPWFTKSASRVGPQWHEWRFADALAKLGAQPQAMQGSYKCRANQSLKACFQSLVATGRLGRLARVARPRDYGWVGATIIGKVSYNWRDASGGQKSGEMPYKLFMHLQHLQRKDLAECGGLIPHDPQAKRPPSSFRIGQKNYRINGNLSRQVRVGKGRNFTFNLRASKTSLHKFRSVVQFSDGSRKRSPWVVLSFFNPPK